MDKFEVKNGKMHITFEGYGILQRVKRDYRDLMNFLNDNDAYLDSDIDQDAVVHNGRVYIFDQAVLDRIEEKGNVIVKGVKLER